METVARDIDRITASFGTRARSKRRAYRDGKCFRATAPLMSSAAWDATVFVCEVCSGVFVVAHGFSLR